MYVVHIVVVGSRISRQKRTTEERVVERETELVVVGGRVSEGERERETSQEVGVKENVPRVYKIN